MDPSSGRTYYQNIETGETSWTLPTDTGALEARASSSASPWVERHDPGSGRMFYQNVQTGESSWTKPDGFNGSSDEGGTTVADAGSGAAGDEEKNGQASSDSSSLSATADTSNSQTARAEAMGDWIERFDQNSNRAYYQNIKTGESRWAKPEAQSSVGGAASKTAEAQVAPSQSHSWVQRQDPTSGRMYFQNTTTGETSWSPPEGFGEQSKDSVGEPYPNESGSLPSSRGSSQTGSGSSVAGEAVPESVEAEVFWFPRVDNNTGRVYYQSSSGLTQWTRPDPTPQARRRSISTGVRGEWERREDPRQKDENGEPQVFYFNRSTGQSQWNKPDGWSDARAEDVRESDMTATSKTKNSGGSAAGPASVAAALALAAAAVVKKKKHAAEPLDPTKRAGTSAEATNISSDEVLNQSTQLDDSGDWKRMQDPESKRVFFYNQSTGESRWDKPAKENAEVQIDFAQLRSVSSPTRVSGDWTEMASADGQIFFYNKATGESQFEQPEGFPSNSKVSAEDSASEKMDHPSDVVQRHQQWSRRHDEASKRDFYFNENTGESQWSRPDGFPLEPGHEDHVNNKMVRRNSVSGDPKSMGHRRMSHVIIKKGLWDRMEDPNTKRIFYHNSVTGETSWTRPEGFKDNAQDNFDSGTADTGSEDVKAVRKSSVRSDKSLHKWIPKKDEASGRYYYYNAETGASQWEEPEEIRLVREEEEEDTDFLKVFTLGGAITPRMRSNSVTVESKGEWKIMRDPKSQVVFYYNTKTGNTQWNEPSDLVSNGPSGRSRRRSLVLSASGEWELMRDPVSHRTFYHNKVLNKSQWHKPAGFGDSVFDGESVSHVHHLAPDKNLAKSGVLIAESGGWKLILDTVDECVSYHNEVLNESSWDMPANFEAGLASVPKGAVGRSEKIEELNYDEDGKGGTSVWFKMRDPENSNLIFYYNPEKKISQWDRPKEFRSDANEATDVTTPNKSSKAVDEEETNDVRVGASEHIDKAGDQGEEDKEKGQRSIEAGVPAADESEDQSNKSKQEDVGASEMQPRSDSKTNETKSDRENSSSADTKDLEKKAKPATESNVETKAKKKATTEKSSGKKKKLGGSLRRARARRKKMAEEAAKKKKEEKEKKEKEAAEASARAEEENPLLAMLSRSGMEEASNKEDKSVSHSDENPLLSMLSRSGSDGDKHEVATSASAVAEDASASLLSALSKSQELSREHITMQSSDGKGTLTKEISTKNWLSSLHFDGAFAKDSRSVSSSSIPANDSPLMACLSSLKISGCLHEAHFSTAALVHSARERVDRTAEFTHRLMRDILWAEWRRGKGLGTFREVEAAASSPSVIVARRKALANLGELISAVCDSPKLVVAIGCKLPAQAQPDFAATIVDLIFSEFSSDERPLLMLIDEAAKKLAEMYQMQRSLMRSMYGKSAAADAAIAEASPSRRNRNFLGYILERFCVRSNVVSFGSAIAELAEKELRQCLTAFQKYHIHQQQELRRQSETKNDRRRSGSPNQRRRIASQSPPHQLVGSGGEDSMDSGAKINILKLEMKSAALRAATRISRILTTQWSKESMPDGLRSALDSLQRSQPGPISALSALVDLVIFPAVDEWFVYNSTESYGLIRLTRAYCTEVTQMVMSVLCQVAEMEMEMNIDNGKSTTGYSPANASLRVQSALIPPRIALTTFLEDTLSQKNSEDDNNHPNASQINLTREATGRIVASCFDLYLFHIAVDRYAQDPLEKNNVPNSIRTLLHNMHPPAPLPGTQSLGMNDNPYVIVPIPCSTHTLRNSAEEEKRIDNLIGEVQSTLAATSLDTSQVHRLKAKLVESSELIRSRINEVARQSEMSVLVERHLAMMKQIVAVGEGMHLQRTPRSADRAALRNSSISQDVPRSPAAMRNIADNTGSPFASPLNVAEPSKLAVPTLGSPLHELLSGVFSPLKLEQTAPW